MAHRIDVAATALYFGAKPSDISPLDLAFAPPYSTAGDCLPDAPNMLGNKRLGAAKTLGPLQLRKELLSGHGPKILDLRHQEEFREGHIPEARSFPINALREELR